MNSNTSKIGYDIEFQKFIGSISHSVVFFNVLSMISGNIENTDRTYRYSSSCHLGKIGVCVTQGEMANYLCIKKSTVTKCMQNLITQKIIGMDYVILEMIRCPFFFIEELGKKFCDTKQDNLRCLYPHILEKTGCISDAVVHGHVAYWNEHGKLPLIHSMMEISRSTGLAYRQIQFSIKKLIDLGLIIAETHVDKRYSLIALQTKAGMEKNVDGCGTERRLGWKNPQKPLEDSVEILDVLGSIDKNRMEEETPPPVFAHESSEKKEPIIERTYRNGLFEVRESVYHEWKKIYKQEDMDYVFNRFNRERKEGRTLKNTHELEFYRLMDFRLTDKSDRMEKDGRKEQEQEEQQRIERDKEQASIDAAIAESNARMRQRLDSLDPKPQEIKPSIETPKTCEVVTMKSIEASKEKGTKEEAKQKILEAQRKRREAFWDSLSETERGGMSKEAFLAGS